MLTRTLLGLALALTAPAAAPAQKAEELHFTIAEGAEHNVFFRRGAVAAHLALKPRAPARLVIAFPAGNSGVGLWSAEPVAWGPVTSVRPVERATPAGVLRGVTAELSAQVPMLKVRQALLSSVRVLRDYGHSGKVPPEVETRPVVQGRTVTWARRRLDGGAGYLLSVELLSGRIEAGGDAVRFVGAPGEPLRLRVTGLTGDIPVTPIADLLTPAAAPDQRLRDVLAFLGYRERLNAGSWRYNTYFGRDTLMSLRLLDDAITPQAWEAGLGSVLDRLSEGGEVPHEEDIGEFAALRRLSAGERPSVEPIFDYKMVDGDFMLAPVAAHYLLGAGRERAGAFLERRTPGGARYGDALVRNLRFVLAQAAPFARAPVAANLIALKPGEPAGDWRDSTDGLGGGRYSFSVNGAFVPAALAATARLAASGLLAPYAGADDLAGAARMAATWSTEAPKHFLVTIPADEARRALAAYAAAAGLTPPKAIDSTVRFHAVALDENGKPIPILNSDEGFRLLFADPPAAEVEAAVAAALGPFPAGLLTGAGMVVANPAYADAGFWPRFDRRKYHGTVIWSWQQALMAAGIERQLCRTDLPATTRATLRTAQARLWAAIEAARPFQSAELWSWREASGRYEVVPFGQAAADETEANAAQLWSSVYLGVRPPKRARSAGGEQPAR